MAALISLTALGVAFDQEREGVPVLDGIDLKVQNGEFVALVGASGSGKSTLLRVVAGLLPATTGSVAFAGGQEAGRRRYGLVFQEPRLLPWRRVLGNVEFGLEGHKLSRVERQRLARQALTLVGLADYAERWPHELSGGQRQRVGIARALAIDPDVLLMDEPFGALDTVTRSTLQDELVRIWRQTGKTILFVTHDLDEAVFLADRIVMLAGRPARIVQDHYNLAARLRKTPAGARLAQNLAEALADSYVI